MEQSTFETQWSQAAPSVRAYLASACRDTSLVDDLMQEIAMTAWRKRSQFEQERSFQAWTIGMARFALLRHRRDLARQKVILAPDLIERLETLAANREPDPANQSGDQSGDRRQALAACVKALSESAQELLKIRYEKATPLAEAANQLGRSHGAIRTALARLRDSLRRCVRDRLRGTHRGDDAYKEEV